MPRITIFIVSWLVLLPSCKLSQRRASTLATSYGNASASSSNWRSGGNRIASTRTSNRDSRTKLTPNYDAAKQNYASSSRDRTTTSMRLTPIKPTQQSVAAQRKVLTSKTATAADKRLARKTIARETKAMNTNTAKNKFEKRFGKKYNARSLATQRLTNQNKLGLARIKIRSNDPKLRREGRKELRRAKSDRRALRRTTDRIKRNDSSTLGATKKRRHKRTSDPHTRLTSRNSSVPPEVSYSRNNGYYTPYGGYFYGGYSPMVYGAPYRLAFLESYVMFSLWQDVIFPNSASGEAAHPVHYGGNDSDGSFQSGYEAGLASGQENIDIDDPRAQDVYDSNDYADIDDRFPTNEQQGEGIYIEENDIFKVPADMSIGICTAKFGATLLVKRVDESSAEVIYFTPNESGISDALECSDEGHAVVQLALLWDMNRNFRGRQVVEYGEGAALINKEFDGNPFHEIAIDASADITICGASDPNGLYNTFSKYIAARFYEQSYGSAKARYIKTGGSRDNVDLIEVRECQVGIVQADALTLAEKEPGRGTLPFIVLPLFKEYGHLICRADAKIESLEDLAKKVDSQIIMVGGEGSGSALTWINAMNKASFPPFNIATIGGQEATDKLLHGQSGADCMFTVIGLDSTPIKKIAAEHRNDLKMISFWDDAFADGGDYSKTDIEPINYSYGFIPKTVTTVAVTAMFVVQRTWAENNPTLYEALQKAYKRSKPIFELMSQIIERSDSKTLEEDGNAFEGSMKVLLERMKTLRKRMESRKTSVQE